MVQRSTKWFNGVQKLAFGKTQLFDIKKKQEFSLDSNTTTSADRHSVTSSKKKM
uniref:Uncharacterized protein n=1 Tax=Setaria italica TaxID=4555 RepID=K3Y0U1_SETIT